MIDSRSAAELESLVELLGEGDFTPQDSARLATLLNDNDENRRHYIRLTGLRVNLHWRYGQQMAATNSPTTNSAQPLSASDNVLDEASAVVINVKPADLSRRKKRFDSIHWQLHRIRFNTMTAVLTALACVGFSFFVWLSTTPDDSRPKRDGVNVNFVARITGQYEHRWAESTRGIPWHAFLVPGEELHLVEGLVEITFYDGAVVVLEGPSEFVVDSRGTGTLEVGKLSALVSEQAAGFTIKTPRATIVDLGTAFGVELDRHGKASVHVFEGQVEVADGSGQHSRQLVAGESLEISIHGSHLVGDADGGRFVRDLAAADPTRLVIPPEYVAAVKAAKPRVYWRFEQLDGGLSPNEMGVGNSAQFVGSADLHVRDKNGCALFPRFDYPECYVSGGELSGELSAYTIEFWMRPASVKQGPLFSLLSSESDSLHAVYLALVAPGHPKKPSVTLRYLHRSPPGKLGGTNLFSDCCFQLGVWQHVAAVHTGERLFLYVDGRLAAEGVDDRALTSEAHSIVIGTHPEQGRYIGLLDEVAIYDKALSPEEVLQHYHLVRPALESKGER